METTTCQTLQDFVANYEAEVYQANCKKAQEIYNSVIALATKQAQKGLREYRYSHDGCGYAIDELLDILSKLFEKAGFTKFTVKKICHDVGYTISPPSICVEIYW